jgi:predicted helicase
MLVQHLLTEPIFHKVFNNQEFLSRNVITAEIEKVIRSITDHVSPATSCSSPSTASTPP